jgi:hypothetical protein
MFDGTALLVNIAWDQFVSSMNPGMRLGKGWMSDKVWRQVKRSISIPCVDVILENAKGEILLGWRKIPPYQNVWALPGGRILKGETLRNAARRILDEYALAAGRLYLVGAFPVKFPTRADLTICLASMQPRGAPHPDGVEFSSFKWTKTLPSKIGANYRRMILKWRHLQQFDEHAIQFAELI